MVEAKDRRTGTGSAAELLGNWRAAERDLAAAQATAGVTSLAAAAAASAVTAATETGEAARLSMEAAQRAERSALRTAEAAMITARVAQHEKQSADTALERSFEAETDAAARFHEAQALDFPPG
jgi:precorrin-2 methylase